MNQRELLDEIVKTERAISNIKQTYMELMKKQKETGITSEEKERIRLLIIEETAKLEINESRHGSLKKRQKYMINEMINAQ